MMISKPFDLGPKFVSAERLFRQSEQEAASISVLDVPPRAVCLPSWRRWFPSRRTSSSLALSRRQRCRKRRARPALAIAIGLFSLAAKCAGWRSSGQLDYVPISLEEVPELLTSGRLPIDVALLQVSPPDARGFVSLGVSVDLAPAVLSVARRVIAEVNPAMPRTHGESFVHLDRFDALVNVDVPVAEYLHPETGEVAERVARYIASIIDDGSTLQIGLGRVPT